MSSKRPLPADFFDAEEQPAPQAARSDADDIADQLPDIQPGDEDDLLDLPGLKRKLVALDKKISANQEQRMKYMDEPARFMESEIALDQQIHDLHAISVVPHL